MTKIIIAGSRNFSDKELLYKTVDRILSCINDDIEIVSGHCRGADILGEQYAIDHNLKYITFPADWKSYGKSAGYYRNMQMAEYAGKNGILIAFPINESKGTNMMIKIAKNKGLTSFVINIIEGNE